MELDGANLNRSMIPIRKMDKVFFNLSYKKGAVETGGENATLNDYIILDISKTGGLKSFNSNGEADAADGSLDMINTPKRKMAGVTSGRERWEDAEAVVNGKSYHNFWRGPGYGNTLMQAMSLLEPDTYEKVKDLYDKADEIQNTPKEVLKGGLVTIYYAPDELPLDLRKEKERLCEEAMKFELDFRRRRFYKNGQWIGNEIKDTAMRVYDERVKLEAKHSDGVHYTSVNFYNDEDANIMSKMWKEHTKFNILLTNEQMMKLGVESEKDGILKLIDGYMKNLKEIEKMYEGDKTCLQFGIKLNNSGSVTYHANYTGCGDSDGIYSKTADELLKKLMADKQV